MAILALLYQSRARNGKKNGAEERMNKVCPEAASVDVIAVTGGAIARESADQSAPPGRGAAAGSNSRAPASSSFCAAMRPKLSGSAPARGAV